MIINLQKGLYQLIETKGQTKILILDDKQTYAWINAGDIGEILVTTHKQYAADCILSVGMYRLYKVSDEPDFTDMLHLELCTGMGVWQGYLLPTGFPDEKKIRNKIIPTKELITRSVDHIECIC